MFSNILLMLTSIGLIFSQGSEVEKPCDGSLEISFRLNSAATDEVVPSYQTVVWLETPDGVYVRSLLVSEYISYGGFLQPEICPSWHTVADWETNYETEMDAVTAATPGLDETVLTFSCQKEKFKPGLYKYNVQTHIVQDFNILYTGEIRIGGEENENVADVAYSPSKHVGAERVLDNVRARYYR